MLPVLSVIGFGEPVTLTTRRSTFVANSAAGAAAASAASTNTRRTLDMNLSLCEHTSTHDRGRVPSLDVKPRIVPRYLK